MINPELPPQPKDDLSVQGIQEEDYIEEHYMTYGSKSYRPMNRGQKFKAIQEQPVHLPKYRTMADLQDIDSALEYTELFKKTALVLKRQRSAELPSPYYDIDIAELWGMPNQVEDLVESLWVRRALQSNSLDCLSISMMTSLERDQTQAKPLNRLLDILNRDDPMMQDVDLEKDMGTSEFLEFRENVQVTEIQIFKTIILVIYNFILACSQRPQ